MVRPKFILTIVLSCFLTLFMASCATLNSGVQANSQTTEEASRMDMEQPLTNEEMSSPTMEEGPRKIVGAFRSVKGVMDPLSCYCDNGGYVDSPAGETLPVCFDDNQNVQSTDYIYIEGTMIIQSIESNGACPAGTMNYLEVESYSLTP
ncbi:MAG: hypothetical protein ACFHU9_12385 [Fluviicola sp.]